MAKIPRELQLTDQQLGIWHGRLTRAYTARAERYWQWRRINDYRHGRYLLNDSGHDRTILDNYNIDRVTGQWHLVAVRQTLAQLYFQYPRMNFTPRAARSIEVIKPLENLVAYERSLIRAHLEERDALINNLWYGTGILKFAWNAEYGLEAPTSDNLGKRALRALAGKTNEIGGHLDDIELPQGAVTEHNPNFISGHPWIKSIHPLDFLVDPEAMNYEEARWVAHVVRRPWIQAVNDSRYENEARKELQVGPAGRFFDSGDGSYESDFRRDNPDFLDSSLVTIYEIFDKTTQRIIVLSGSTSKPLMVRPYPFFGRTGPYVVSQLIPTDENFWGVPWSDTFTPQITAMNTLRTQMMNHIQRWGVPKGAFRKGEIDEEDLQRLANSLVGEFVSVDMSTEEDIRNALMVFPALSLNADTYRAAEMFKNDMQEISGVTENQLGGGKGVQTATEASIVNQQSGLRTGDMRFVVDQMLRDSTRNIVSLMRQFWQSKDIIPIVGPEGQSWDLSGQQLNFEYDADVEPGSTERIDRNARMRQSVELLQVLASIQPLMQQQGQQINLGEVVREVLQNNDIVKNPDRIIQPVGLGAGVPGGGPIPGQLPGPAAVGPQDNVINASEAFASGRQLSEAAQ